MAGWNPEVLGWSPAVRSWNRILERKWVAGNLRCLAGALQCGAGTGFLQESGRLESSGAWLESCSAELEPDSRKKMGGWNQTPVGAIKIIKALC